jgi:hypothetical protein
MLSTLSASGCGHPADDLRRSMSILGGAGKERHMAGWLRVHAALYCNANFSKAH